MKLCAAMAMVCCIPYFSMAGIEESYMKCRGREDARGCVTGVFHPEALEWINMKIVCGANQQLPICGFVNRLVTVKENYSARRSANFRLSSDLHNAARPYIKEFCITNASHAVCEALSTLVQAN